MLSCSALSSSIPFVYQKPVDTELESVKKKVNEIADDAYHFACNCLPNARQLELLRVRMHIGRQAEDLIGRLEASGLRGAKLLKKADEEGAKLDATVKGWFSSQEAYSTLKTELNLQSDVILQQLTHSKPPEKPAFLAAFDAINAGVRAGERAVGNAIQEICSTPATQPVCHIASSTIESAVDAIVDAVPGFTQAAGDSANWAIRKLEQQGIPEATTRETAKTLQTATLFLLLRKLPKAKPTQAPFPVMDHETGMQMAKEASKSTKSIRLKRPDAIDQWAEQERQRINAELNKNRPS